MRASEMRPPFRLLVTGSRTWDDIATIGQALAVILAAIPVTSSCQRARLGDVRHS